MFKKVFFVHLLVFSAAASADFTFSGESYLSDQEIRPADSIMNSYNRLLLNPSRVSELDLRLDLKYTSENTKFVLRPRWLGAYQEVTYTDTNQITESSLGKIDLTDAFVEWSATPTLQTTAGLIVEGWGPVEFVNPTNPFFHTNSQSKNFFFKQKGQVLAKINWTPSGRSTLSVVAEPVSNQETSWRYGTNFSPSAMIRTEAQSEDSSTIIGLIVGADSFKSNLFGEYFSFSSSATGISGYFEGRHTQNSSRFYPTSKAGFISLDLTEQQSFNTYSVLGFRYEGRVDARIEWIDYELGYSESEWRQVYQGVTQFSPYLVENLKKFQAPGMEFLTKNWISLSVRTPDIGPKSKWQWTNRALISMGDSIYRTTLLQTDLEMPTKLFGQESWTFYLEGRFVVGDANTEMLLNSSSMIAAGGRFAW